MDFERYIGESDQYHDIIDTYSLDHTPSTNSHVVQCIAIKIFAEYNLIHEGKYQLRGKRVMGIMYSLILFNHHVS